jgi:hypothetical protein
MLQEAAVDLMVVGNWVHDSGDVRGTRQRLLQLEMEANVRIFPSFDYLECFTHKERYYPRLARFCRRKRREQTGPAQRILAASSPIARHQQWNDRTDSDLFRDDKRVTNKDGADDCI